MMEEKALQTYLKTRATHSSSAIRSEGLLSLLAKQDNILSYDDDGAAHITIDGILTPNGPDIIDRLYGVEGTSYKGIITSLQEADAEMDNPKTPIYMHVNSPGGMVFGAEATAATVVSVAGHRPVVAINEGLMASAALWISSGATRIESRGRSTLTGSVGAIMTTVEYDIDGINIYNFVNPESPHKAPDPSTEEGAQVFVDMVSSMYAVFRDDLVAGRAGRTTIEKVESLKGAVVTANEAIKVGLMDGITGGAVKDNTPAIAAGNEDGSVEVSAQDRDREEIMNLSEFLKENPAAKSEMDALISQARSEGEQAARESHANTVAKLKPIMDGEYPERVKTACADAVAGTRSVESVFDLVAIFDEIKAQKEGADSDAEQEDMPDTPASGPEVKTKADESMARDAEWNKTIMGLLG